MRNSILFFLVLIAVTYANAQWPQNPIPRNGLVAYYPFCGNAKDESGNGNDGSVNGATLTLDRFGNSNGAYSFNGVNSSIDIPHNNIFDNIETNNLFTYSVWIYIRNGGSNDKFSLFSKYEATNDDGWELSIKPGAGMIFLTCSKTLGTNMSYSSTLNQWTNIAIVYNALANILKCYVNGSLVLTKTFNSSLLDTYGEPVTIGKDLIGLDEYNDGLIDDLFLYNRALSDAEVQQLYNAGPIDCIQSQPIMSDESDALWSIVKPQLVSRDIDMGNVCVGSFQDSTFNSFISNTGTTKFTIDSIKITGTNANEFKIISNFTPPAFDLRPGDRRSIEFDFNPSSIGVKNASIEIYSLKEVIIKNITGTGVKSNIQVLSNFIVIDSVKIKEHKDTTVTLAIKNISNKTINITRIYSIGPDAGHFEILSGKGGFNLAPGEVKSISIRFSPTFIGRVNENIGFQIPGNCSDEIIQLLGIGIPGSPTISVTGDINNSFTCLNEKIDSLKISNTGAETLVISNANIVGADPTSFELIDNISDLSIEPSKDTLIKIRTIPKNTGINSAQLEIHSNADPDSILTFPLSCKKDSISIVPEYQIVNFGRLLPNEQKDTILILQNKGTIQTAYSAQSTSGISINKFTGSIKTNEFDTIVVHFGGNANPGIIDDTVTVIDNLCNRINKIQIIGSIGKNKPKIQSDNIISFNNIICESSSSTTLTVKNTGGDSLIISQAQISNPEFTFSTPFSETIIEPDSEKVFTLNFTPLGIGNSNGTLTFISNADPDSILTIPLSAIKDSIGFSTNEVKIDLGNLKYNATSNKSLTIKNTGTIKCTYILSVTGNIQINPAKITLQAQEEAIIDIFFPGTDTVTTINEQLTITDTICNFANSIGIEGIVFSASAEISTIELEGYPGDTINVPIILKNQENIQLSGATSLKTDLTYNPTLLTPLDHTTQNMGTITLSNLPISTAIGEPLTKVSFKVGLGNAEECDLLLTNAEAMGGTADISVIKGHFTLLGICKEGGTRLFDSDGKITMSRIAPNPTTGDFELNINLIEFGYTEIYMTNSIGVKVKDVFKGDISEEGEYKYKINTFDITSGMYYIVLQTPTVRKLEKIIVEK